MRAGFAKVDMTPAGSVPLAGYFKIPARYSSGIQAPIFARSIAISAGDTTVVIVVLDLLIITTELAELVQDGVARRDPKARVLVIATHSHSCPGGFWHTGAARMALGPFCPGALERLAEAAIESAVMALGDRRDARVATGQRMISGVATSRRRANSPMDQLASVIVFWRGAAKGVLSCFGAHPVLAAELSPGSLSGDLPGEVVRILETKSETNSQTFAAHVSGALGGVGIECDHNLSLEPNLAAAATPIVAAASQVVDQEVPRDVPTIRYMDDVIELPPSPEVQVAFADQSWSARLLLSPLRAFAQGLFGAADFGVARIQAVAIGDALIIGTPFDLGTGPALALRAAARSAGFRVVMPVSQCGGYFGYTHLGDEYVRLPPRGTRAMALYENLMSVFGYRAGDTVVVTATAIIERLAAVNE